MRSHESIHACADAVPKTPNQPPTPLNEQKDGKKISPWHDIPLKADGQTFNFITEIPKL